jgi:predicted peptidase
MSRSLTLLFLSFLCATALCAQESRHLETSRMTAQTLVIPGGKTNTLQYLLYLPKAYETNRTTQWPLLLFLHGSGERTTNLFDVSWHGPPKLIRENHDLPFIVISPQCPPGKWWDNATLTASLLALLDDIQKQYRVDTNRTYLTGLSMGGSGTWNLGLKYPERFAAIAPICGTAYLKVLKSADSKKTDAIKSLGIWIFHGAKDPTVSFNNSDRMNAALKEMGCTDLKYTKYANADHDSWTVTYNNPALYHWLLAHHRNP